MIVIPIDPKTKKNSQQIIKVNGRPIIIPSKQYRDYEKQAISYIEPPENPIDYGVNVKCIFYMRTKRKVDLSNLISAISDILVRAGVLADDNSEIIVGYDGSRVYYDKENPRTEVEIEKIRLL